MISNLLNHTVIYCMNHKKPVPMVVETGNTPFYACPRYRPVDSEHPHGHAEDESPCGNRVSILLVSNILDKFMNIVEKDRKEGVFADYTGMQFTYHMVHVRILRYDTKALDIGVLNRRVLG